MKLSMKVGEIQSLIGHVAGVADKRGPIPALQNILIKTSDDGKVEMHATDLEVGIIGYGKSDASTEGAITVSADKLSSFVKLLDKKETISMGVQTNGRLKIRCGQASLLLATESAGDFPEVILPTDGAEVLMDASKLLDMLTIVTPSISSDETRRYLCGTLLELKDEVLHVVTTDGHRLTKCETTLSGVKGEFKVILPSKAGLIFRKSLAGLSEEVSLLVSGKKLTLVAGDYSHTTKLIDANFPDYTAVIPQGNEIISLDMKQFNAVINRAMIVANEFTHDLSIHFDGESASANITAIDSKDGANELEESVETNGTFKKLTVGFNGRYLQDALRSMKGEVVELHFKDELSPALVTEKGNTDTLRVLMPVRI